MDEYMLIRLPNEGEIAMNLSNIVHWDISNVRVIGDSVFFEANGSTLGARLEEFEKYLPKHLTNDK